MQLAVNVPDDLVERIAERAAELAAERSSVEIEGFIDVQGAADFLACPKSRIYSLVNTKRMPHHRDGSRLLFDPHELRQFVQNGGAKRP